MMIELVLLGALVVAFVNGANDNFKGVATLYGSGLLSYRRALVLGTAATAVGGIRMFIARPDEDLRVGLPARSGP